MRILVVEDEGIIATNLADSLRKAGYEVSGISISGEDALEKVRTLKPDLVLMDVQLNGEMDGIETAEQVRSRFSIPVIFLTAGASQEVLDRAKRTNPFGYLIKPVRQADLVSTIEVAAYKHEMERQLKQREAWLATTLRCAGDGVIVTDARGRIEFLNDLSKRILGIHDRNVIGENFCDVVRLRSRFTGAPTGDLVQLAILQGATMSIGSDLILVDTLDQETDLEGDLAISEVNGLIVGTVFTFRDVTVRNHQDDQLRQDIGSRACARLAGTLSAELGILLQAAIGDDKALLQGDSVPDNRHSYESTRARHLGSISKIVNQLDVMSLRKASFPRRLDLNALVLEACRELRPGVPINIDLTSQLQPDVVGVYADPIQIKRAIISLILHSQDSMPNGGTIHIATQNRAIERHGRTGQTESYIKLTVQNTNSGVPPDEANQLAEPLSGAIDQLDLKLFVIHEIISDARGSIRAKARPCQGMSFEILLPQSQKNSQGFAAAALPEPRQESAAILFVHSDHAIRKLVSEGLEREGYEAMGARDVPEALDWLTLYSGSIALLIANLEISDTRATALAEQIAIRNPELSVVFTADHAVDPSLKSAWTKNGARFLEQPFRLEDLLRNVNEMLASGDPAGLRAA